MNRLNINMSIDLRGNETKQELEDAIYNGIRQTIRDEMKRSIHTTQVWEWLEQTLAEGEDGSGPQVSRP